MRGRRSFRKKILSLLSSSKVGVMNNTVVQLIQRITGIQLRRKHVLLFIAALLVASVTAPLLTARTFSHEPEKVDLIGILHREVVPGPPNYENIMAGDRPETVWFVTVLEQSIAQNDDRASSNGGQPVSERIQLLLPENRYNDLLNRKVVASGTLFDAHTVHHHTPVLMFVTKVRTY